MPKDLKISINLASWNHDFECKLTRQVFSFDILLVWVIHQIVNIFIQDLPNPWWVQNFIFPNRKHIFPNLQINSFNLR